MNAPWTRRNFLHASCLGAAALARTSPAQDIRKSRPDADSRPLDIGSTRQLFHDDLLLDLALSQNVRRTLNPPHRIQRVLKPEQPWEALGFVFYCGVVDDGGTA